MKIKFFLLTIVLISIACCGCELILQGQSGVISFPDFSDQDKLMGGNAGLLNFGGKTVELGERAVLPLTIKNTGEGPLVIENIHILQAAVPEGNPVDALDAFSFVNGTFPALPLSIPAGNTVDDIFIEFAPETAGSFSGKLYVETKTDTHYIDLNGDGLWQLTVEQALEGALTILKESGDISIQAGVGGGSITDVSETGVFTILCEPQFLRKLVSWENADGYADFENAQAEKTTITLENHAVISANIINPYVQFSGGDLQAAVNNCDGSPEIGVVIQAGTYTVNGDLVLNANSPIYGGYSGFTLSDSRAYKTPSERALPAHQTILNVTGTITVSGFDKLDNVMLEGLTINKVSGGDYDDPLILYDEETTAGLRYNTISGGGVNSGAAVHVTNGSNPLIKYNYITGGNTTAANSESCGIKITEGAKPVIYKNSITGGTAAGTDSASYGIFCDFEAGPYLRNNTPLSSGSWGISGGSAPDSGGKSFGVFIINNGNILAEYNTVDGGTGQTAVGMYTKYGSYIDAFYNNILTSGGSSRMGIWADHMGRVYRLKYNSIYDCEDALYKDPYAGNLKTIDAVNNKYNTDTNSDTAADLSDAPSEVDYE